MKQAAITIGIPVFNEEKNIIRLIDSIRKQKEVKIARIIISSDGSTDGTVKAVKKLKSKRIVLIDNSDRKGIARGLNQIISKTKSGILVTLDADIRITDPGLIKKLVTPILNGQADLTASNIKALKTKGLIDSAINSSMEVKNVLFNHFKKGQNLYTCYGLARGFSKNIYGKIKFPVSAGNDMYSYLFCISKKLKFMHVKSAVVYYKLPENITDHLKQSSRFYGALDIQNKYFRNNLVNSESRIPASVYILSAIKSLPLLIRKSYLLTVYFAIQIYSKTYKEFGDRQVWAISGSTKNI